MKRYAKSHEWVEVVDNSATVGISKFAAEELGDVTYLEMPELGSEIKAGEMLGSIESVKAASDIFAPIGGTVIAVNEALATDPAILNQSPEEEEGWICRLEKINAADLAKLMSEAEYLEFVRK
ncbi:MAG: glycine cleavage system protein GcvH [Lentisphaeria bacterium]